MAYSGQYTQADLTPAVYDFIVGIFVGMAGLGVLVGLGIGLALVGKHIGWVKFK